MNSLYGTPVTGLQGASFALEVVANNIANLNTSGFETVEPVLGNLPTQAEVGDQNNGYPVPESTHVGMGTQAAATQRSQAQEPLIATGNTTIEIGSSAGPWRGFQTNGGAIDLAISGPGFIAVQQPNGPTMYTRQTTLQLQQDGQLVTSDGLQLVPPVRVPAGVSAITIDSAGRILGLNGATQAGGRVLGRVTLATFPAPENLRALGQGLYAPSLGSGRAQAPVTQTANGVQGTQLLAGYQLGSTVDLASEMTMLIEAQRMYEVNTKSLQTIDSLVHDAVSLQPR